MVTSADLKPYYWFGTKGADSFAMPTTLLAAVGLAGSDHLTGTVQKDFLVGDFFTLSYVDAFDDAGHQIGPIPAFDLTQRGDDWLSAGDGDDFLVADQGDDTLIGGAGNDEYHVWSQNMGSDVFRSGGDKTGLDKLTIGDDWGLGFRYVVTSRLVLDAASNVTQVELNGFGLHGTSGGDLFDFSNVDRFYYAAMGDTPQIIELLGGADVFHGSKAVDFVLGGMGNDTLTDGSGGALLSGGDGDDRLVDGSGSDTLLGGYGDDQLISHGQLPPDGADPVSDGVYGGKGNDSITAIATPGLIGAELHGDGGMDTIRGGENATYAFGGADADTLYGNGGADTLSGGSGRDQVGGGIGNDLLTGDSGDDRLYGGDGHDSLQGGDGLDRLYGGAGNDDLNGGAGADVMVGGLGNDSYIIDDASDIVTELAGGGDDAMETTLAEMTIIANVESMSFSGTGNFHGVGSDNAEGLTGGIDGLSILEGLGGDDDLYAGPGDAQLYGGEGDDRLYALYGDATLDGGAGADVMRGGRGDNTYYVDRAGDRVEEGLLGGGTDTIYTTLANQDAKAGIEVYIHTTASDFTFFGGAANETVSGNSGDDSLMGGAGSNMLTGGAGADVFSFYFVNNGQSAISDFTQGQDHIGLLNAVGSSFPEDWAKGPLADAVFKTLDTGTADADDRILYDQAHGKIYYDADGLGGEARVLFATVTPGLALTSADFTVI